MRKSEAGEEAVMGAPAGRFEALVARLREAVLGGPGVTQPGLRQAVEARAAALSGRVGAARAGAAAGGELPEDLGAFADRVAGGAWRVTPEEVAALLEAGYSEEEVFEVTVSAALGAGCGRLERGLAAMRGEV